MKCVMMCWIVSCLCMSQVPFLKLWKPLNLADSLMIWFMELSLECCLAISFKVLCLMLLEDSDKRMKVFMMIRQTNATFVTCQEKWCKRKENPLLNIPEISTFYGTMYSTLLPLREKIAMITLVLNMKFHLNMIVLMKKWMLHGCLLKENLSSVLLTKQTNLLRK